MQESLQPYEKSQCSKLTTFGRCSQPSYKSDKCYYHYYHITLNETREQAGKKYFYSWEGKFHSS